MRNERGLASQGVRLEADEFPFGRYRAAGETRTDAAGRLRFRVKPRASTRYRAVAEDLPDTRSSEVRVPVAARFKVHQDDLGDDRFRVTIFLRYSPRLSLAGVAVHHYVGDRDLARRRGKVPYAKTTPLRNRKPGLSVVDYTFRIGPGGIQYTACIHVPPARGVANPSGGAFGGRAGKCRPGRHRFVEL